MINRLQLFEFEDQTWLPGFIRTGMMDNLRFFFQISNAYKNAVPLILKTLRASNSCTIVDLCSGAGGPIIQMQIDLKVNILLTDKFPEVYSIENPFIKYVSDSIDAAYVPTKLKGLRTMFTAFHHFNPRQCKSILYDTVQKEQALCIFEGAKRSLFVAIAIVPFILLLSFFSAPFINPFSLKRLLFTYVIPIIPLLTVWDGCVSFLRLYTAEEMLKMAKSVSEDYHWEAGTTRSFLFFKLQYLIGYKK